MGIKWGFTAVLYAVAGAIIICNMCVVRKRKSTPVGSSIYYLMLMAASAIILHATAILMPRHFAAVLLYGLYYIGVDTLLISVLVYVQRYTGLIGDRTIKVRYGICLATLADTIIFLQNNFNNNVFTCVMSDDGSGNQYYKIVSREALYKFHMIFTYALVVLILATLIAKIIRTPKLYRMKYAAVLYTFLAVIAANFGYLIFSFTFDISLIFYAVLAIFIFYFSLIYVPQGLIEDLLSFSVKDMADGIVCFDIDGKCIYANVAARNIFGVEDDLQPIEEYFSNWLTERDTLSMEKTVWNETWRQGRKKLHLELHFNRMTDDTGKYIGCFFSLYDQTADRTKLEEERYRATHDMLTGIFNREYFYERAAELISGLPDVRFYIVCSDLKNFKLVNDVFGMEQGDAVLKEIAKMLRHFSSEKTVYGRMSGDRFAMCLPVDEFRETDFINAAEQISRFIGNNFFRIHMHIGVYEVANPSLQISVMCDRAYLAIKSIKNSYSDTIAYYNNRIREGYLNEQNIASEFDDALASGSFAMYLQPQVSVKGDVLGGEALVRWHHRDRGMIPPGEFISVFETTGLISRLDMYIWEQACKRLRKWKDEGKTGYHISVNISPKDFYFTDIYKTFTGLVEQYEIDCANLRLEITESSLMSDIDNQLALVERLREYGFAVEIDDFGSGYSSLNTLKDISVDTLKIDMGFLRETEHKERSRDILTMIIALSKKLGIEVITEGVETKEQVDFLTEIGCDIFQGYYFAKPMPVQEFESAYL